MRLEVLEARTADQMSSRFEEAAKAGATSLLVREDPLTDSTRRHLAALAAHFRLPTIYGYKECVEAGGLMSYGTARRQL
jgi:putative tryptophan/tyrosine transport system substrate-binding protein